MATSMKKVLAALGAAGLLAGCATGYDDYGYYGERYAYRDYGPTYYDYYPGYVGPSVGFGFGYSDGDYRRYGYRDHGYRHHEGRSPYDPNWDTFRDGRRRDSGG